VSFLIKNNERGYTQTVLFGNIAFVLISDEFKYEITHYPFILLSHRNEKDRQLHLSAKETTLANNETICPCFRRL